MGILHKLSFLFDCLNSTLIQFPTFTVGTEIVIGKHLLFQKHLNQLRQFRLPSDKAELQIIEDIKGNGLIMAFGAYDLGHELPTKEVKYNGVLPIPVVLPPFIADFL